MSAAVSGLSVLIENLNQLAFPLNDDDRELIKNLKLELKKLKEDLSSCDCESDQYLKTNCKQIRGIVDEAEDAVDTYMISAATQKSRGWMSRLSLQPRELKDAGKQIASTTDELNMFTEKNKRMLQSLAKPPIGSRITSEVPRVEEDHVFGFGKPAEEVLELVVKGRENLEVIAITGVSGLGKTTLAKMVYMDPRVEYEFVIRAFVYISRQYDKKDVLLQILGSFSIIDEAVKNKDEKQLEELIYEKLEGKQYLIVLDAVRETKDWDEFKGAFPCNKKQRCRVLITTTNFTLAEYANSTNPDSLYMLDLLSDDDGKELLQWKIFGLNKFPDEIEKYAHNIANKCSGLPWAIVLVAGVFWDRRDDSWWKEVDDSLSEYNVIEMVYMHLPNKLKLCFIYLGLFPEGYEIPVWKLVRLWISEGFINTEENPDFEWEDIAEQYLEELVQRNLVMVGRKRSNGKMKTCRLHDELGEFCRKVGGEEKLFQVVNFNSSGQEGWDNCRRLCINGSIIVEKLSGLVSGKRVRSFLTFQKKLDGEDEKHVSVIKKAFKFLKVLEAHSLKLTFNFLLDLSRPVLLKYLAVSSDVGTIPSAFSGLWSLQTLIVRTTTSETLKVEMDLWKMPNFRHFHTNSTASLPSPESKSQKSEERSSETSVQIRTLCTISTESCSRTVLDRTRRLKKLGIRGDLAKFYQSLGELKFGEIQHLENLKLINEIAGKEMSTPHELDTNSSKLQSLPSLTCLPPHLTKLTLMKTLLREKEMSIIGKLEKLEVLKLKEVAFQGDKWITEDGAFRNLVHLYIGSSGFKSWNVASPTQTQVATFPKLKTLQLSGCKNLEALPAELAEIPSLHSVVLRSTNPNLASSLRILKDKNNLRLSVYPIHHLDTQAESSS